MSGGRAIPDSEFEVSENIELVDLNQDGHLDVLSGLSFYLNDGGTAPFTAPVPRGRISADFRNMPCDFVSADVNSDEAPDVLTIGCSTGPVYPPQPESDTLVLYLNSQGDVPFSINTEPTATSFRPERLLRNRLLALDMDGDDDVDIAWSTIFRSDFLHSRKKVLLNNGFVNTPMPVLTPEFSDSVIEGETQLSVSLVLSPPSEWPVRVNIATLPLRGSGSSGATPGQDYYGTSKNFVFAPGETVKSFAVSILDDDEIEPLPEWFVLSMYGLDGANVAVDSPASFSSFIHVVDNDSTQLPVLGMFKRSARENDGEVFIQAYLSPRWHKDVSSNVSTIPDPDFTTVPLATPGEDYYGFTQRVTIPAGQERVMIPITVIDDDIAERPVEYAWVQAYQPDQVVIRSNRRNTYVEIYDDDFPILSIQDVVVDESQSRAAVTITTSPAITGRSARVGVATLAGTAALGEDFYGSSRIITVTNDENGSSGTFEIQLIDDNLVESPETIRVILYNPSGATLGKREATVTITSDD